MLYLMLTRAQAGPVIKEAALDASEIISALQTYIDSTKDAKTLVQPLVQLFTDSPVLEHAEEVLPLKSDRSSSSHTFFPVA